MNVYIKNRESLSSSMKLICRENYLLQSSLMGGVHEDQLERDGQEVSRGCPKTVHVVSMNVMWASWLLSMDCCSSVYLKDFL